MTKIMLLPLFVSLSSTKVPQQVPSWLTGALQSMRARYPDDRFEAILRRTTGNPPDWRIRCLDCPGKVSLYFGSHELGDGGLMMGYALVVYTWTWRVIV